MLQFLLLRGAQLIGNGTRQYEMAKQLSSENGHIAVRNVLEISYAQQLMAL